MPEKLHLKILPFWGGLVGGAVGALIIWVCTLFLTLGQGGSGVSIALMEYLRVKVAAMERLPFGNQRIVVFGGSSSFYGISAAEIARRTGIDTVNFGLHAALPFNFLTNRIKPLLRSGDTVLLNLEYQYYRGIGWNQTASDFFLAQPWQDGLIYLPPKDQVQLLITAPLSERLKFLLWSNHTAKRFTETARFKINPAGDYVGHSRLNTPDFVNINEDATGVFQNLIDDNEIPAWDQISAFIEWCQKRNIRVVATFPSLLTHESYLTQDGETASKRLLDAFASSGVDVIGTPLSHLVSRNKLYDTEYHLNSESAKEQTLLLLPDLAKHLGLDLGSVDLKSKGELNSEPFSGFDHVVGLGPLEGPYDGLPFERFRIAKFPEVKIEFTPQAGATELALKLSSITSKQEVIIFCNDAKIANLTFEFGDNDQFVIPLPPGDAGQKFIKLVFSEKFDDHANKRTIAAYVESIQIRNRSNASSIQKPPLPQ